MAIGHKNQQIIENKISRHEPFKIASMSAERLEEGSIVHFGHLPQNDRSTFTNDVSNNSVYVVYSYQTPIAWVKLDGKDEWVMPSERYSNTTANHKAIVRSAIRQIGQ